MYRWIIERSPMKNNDEIVVHQEFAITWQDFPQSDFCKFLVERDRYGLNPLPKLVVCRPVTPDDLAAGLDTSYVGEMFDEHAPKVTHALDALYELVDQVQFRMTYFDGKSKNPTDVLADIIAYEYYDCMSGGMSLYKIIACRMLIEKYKCSLDAEVYPGETGWHTLADWLQDTQDCVLPPKAFAPFHTALRLLTSAHPDGTPESEPPREEFPSRTVS